MPKAIGMQHSTVFIAYGIRFSFHSQTHGARAREIHGHKRIPSQLFGVRVYLIRIYRLCFDYSNDFGHLINIQ